MSDQSFHLTTPDGATAEIHLRGAHLTRWQPAGSAENRLFVSERAVYAEGVAIRGGVPVIFPQFAGEGPLTKHGFARTASWKVLEHQGGVAVLGFSDDAHTRAQWPHPFATTLRVALEGAALGVTLAIRNTGSAPLRFTAALHTYLAVQDIAVVRLHGLEGCHYRDTAHAGAPGVEGAVALGIEGEVDRIYWNTPPALTLEDGTRRLRLEQTGFADTVVWNPGAALSTRFTDLAAEDYRRFLCVEAAAIGRPVALPPGDIWQGSQRLTA